MNIKDYYANKDERPLDRLVEDGGFTSIFRTIACIGDSLSSGEFEVVNDQGEKSYHDMFEYSWGQFMARTIGSKVYNFSRGGMTAEWYLRSFADEKDFFNPEYAAQAYIIALGVNDVNQATAGKMELGGIEDVAENYKDNKPTIIGKYAEIIARYKEIQPDAKFFFVTMPFRPDATEKKKVLQDRHAEIMYQLAERFSNSYVIDLRKYAPVYDEEFRKNFYLHGHLSPTGYALTAKMIMSYIDYIIRNNPDDFRLVGFIGKKK